MRWLKHIVLDVIVTVVILIATLGDARWAAWIVYFYTPLLLLLKVGALAAGGLGGLNKAAQEVPVWAFHVLYAVNVAVLLFDGWWWTGGAWVLIWALSVAAEARSRRPTAARKR